MARGERQTTTDQKERTKEGPAGKRVATPRESIRRISFLFSIAQFLTSGRETTKVKKKKKSMR